MFPFSELLNMTQNYDFLVDVIGLLTSVGEEKEYAKEGKILKMIVLELTSKDLTVRCALFGDYVNQVNYFLASGYVEQPVVVIQLAKVKFFRGQVGLQNVIYATQMLFNPNLPEVVEFTQSMIEQGVNGTQPLFIANEGKVVSLEDDFMRLTRKCTIEELQDSNEEGFFFLSFLVQSKVLLRMEVGGILLVCVERHITNVTPRFKIKITLEDHSGEGIFVFFDREASYLLKKSCADLFTELICGDTYPPIFQGLIGKKLLLKVDTKGVAHDTFYGTFQVRRICDDPTIIAMFELPDYDADNESTPKKESSKTFIKSDKVAGESSGILSKSPVLIDFLAEKQPAVFGGTEFAALINDEDGKDEKTPNNDTEVLSHVLDPPSQYGEKLIHENHVVTSKGKKNLNPQFEEAATDADGRGSKIAKVVLMLVILTMNVQFVGRVSGYQNVLKETLQQTSEIDRELITELLQTIDTHNVIAQSFRRVREFYQCHPSEIFSLKLYSHRKVDRRTYSAPSCDEVAALIVGDFDSSDHGRDIIVRFTAGQFQRIYETHALYWPL
ncbi:hypothetical protein AHAS_Ahas13G0268000 [Arachis hypogaea]